MRVGDVPFYANPDNTHCVQASLRMMLEYFEPEHKYSWEQLEKMTAKLPGKATWKTAMWLWLVRHNYELHVIEPFNSRRFVKEGADYLKNEFGEEAAAWQIKNSNIAEEQRLYKELLGTIKIDNRPPQMSDIQHYLDHGYMVAAAVNSRKLAGKLGYVGHQLIVVGYDDATLTLNNPGPPSNEAQVVSKELFESAWASPNEAAKELFAIKPKV